MRGPVHTLDELWGEIARLKKVHAEELAAMRLTLLDEFALTALNGDLANNANALRASGVSDDDVAVRAYDYAEAMLREREKRR
jgi:hypothetical protein